MAKTDRWIKTGVSSLREGYTPTAEGQRQVPRGGTAATHFRSAETGQFVKVEKVAKDPASTLRETVTTRR